MPPSQLIIDFNRCFEPNPFNTGPAIPDDLPVVAASNEIHSPFPRPGPLMLRRGDVDLPELSNSPASTASSTPSLRLDDEEIKRIFSRPQNNITCDLSKKEDLNPHAMPFIPSFAILGSESPSSRNDVLAMSPDIGCSYAHRHQPHCRPPGLPHPAMNKVPRSVSEALSREPSERPPPAYLSHVLASLKPSSNPHEREILAKRIIASRDIWDVENLLELAEQICLTGCASGPDLDKSGKANPTCHPARYDPVDKVPDITQCQYVEESRKADAVALIAAELHRQFSTLKGEEVAQDFAWNVREVALMQFIHCWNCAKSSSITYKNAPSSRFVRSSLLLCKAIAALFKVDLIEQEHISMCISILLQDLMSVEHTEAVYNIIMGCGQAFWAPGGALESENMLLPREKALRLNYHVHEFITGLHANFTQKSLQDRTSVVSQPWSKGQLLLRLEEIVNAVRRWESTLIEELGLNV